MSLPTKQECYSFLDEYKLPQNVRAHTEQVTKVAVFIAKQLKARGIDVDVDLVERSALLHDLLKPIEFEDLTSEDFGLKLTLNEIDFFSRLQQRFKGIRHEDATFGLFKDKYPEMALVIKKHGYRELLDPEVQPFSWEEKIVTYADKRVAHDKIVSLGERFEEGHKRYFTKSTNAGLSREQIKRLDSAYFRLEKELFDIIGTDPDGIADEIQ
jgi:uncharacterized protein